MITLETKLMCSATDCVNNINGLCAAYIINIQDEKASNSEETYCDTFDESGLGNAVKNMFNMNVVGEAKQIFINESIQMSPEIKCNAEKCMYNSDGICEADYVSISGIGKENQEGTNCETFQI
ncbi:DUF1540 domain-containing protein [Clostridium sp. KNHs214]|uniref:DUF1540 domain-containing protein n=1 Tax=Clostridium sp. KNHs214 TaxID=1540257 RepID=UPI000552BB79|nr:DUF1540 domain-containing protein [Clostridium sp. KNHs214]